MSSGRYPDADDFFADTRMSFGDHIEDLRTHLIRALLGFGAALVASFFVGAYVLDFISAPIERELHHYYLRRLERRKQDYLATQANNGARAQPGTLRLSRNDLEKLWGLPIKDKSLLSEDGAYVRIAILTDVGQKVNEWTTLYQELSPPPTLRTFTIMESVLVWFKVCLICALVLGSPWIFYQIWSFIAAGLYPQEKRLVNLYLPFSVLLFLSGVALCQFVVMPNTISGLLAFNEWLDKEPELRLSDWLNFALLLPIIFGVCFQTPLAMLTLERVGLVTVETYKQKWRIVLFLIAVLYVIVSPTPDPITMLLFLVPMYGLYALGILLCKLSPRQPLSALGDESETDQMIEV